MMKKTNQESTIKLIPSDSIQAKAMLNVDACYIFENGQNNVRSKKPIEVLQVEIIDGDALIEFLFKK